MRVGKCLGRQIDVWEYISNQKRNLVYLLFECKYSPMKYLVGHDLTTISLATLAFTVQIPMANL